MKLPHAIKLSTAIEIKSVSGEIVDTIDEIVFRNPLTAGMVRHLPVAGAQTMSDLFPILSKMTGQPEHIIDRLGLDDLNACMEVVGGFLGAGQGTGETATLG